MTLLFHSHQISEVKMLDWQSFTQDIPDPLLIESLRGNKDLIFFIKKDIKQRAKDTRISNRLGRERQSQIDRRIIAWDAPHPECAPGTNKAFMRHVFLAYAYLRYRPFQMVEPNAKKARFDTWKLPSEKWSTTHKNPSAHRVCDVILWYKEQFEASKQAENVA